MNRPEFLGRNILKACIIGFSSPSWANIARASAIAVLVSVYKSLAD